jgi:hypothetical protein
MKSSRGFEVSRPWLVGRREMQDRWGIIGVNGQYFPVKLITKLDYGMSTVSFLII